MLGNGISFSCLACNKRVSRQWAPMGEKDTYDRKDVVVDFELSLETHNEG